MRNMRVLRIAIAALAAAGALSQGCEKPLEGETETKNAPEAVVAEVGERKITLGELEAEFARYRSLLGVKGMENQGEERIREALLTRLINNAALEIEAEEKNVTVTPESLERRVRELLGEYDEARLGIALAESGFTFDEWKKYLETRMKVEALVKLEVDSKVEVTKDEVEKYYKENADSFVWPRRAHVMQIMVHDETTAEQVREKLLNGADFSETAREVSQSPEAAEGGDLGFISEGLLPPELEGVVFDLGTGDISEVVKSIYGFHIFRVVEREDSRTMSYEEASGRIRKILLEPKREEMFKEWLETLKKKTPIKIHSAVLSASLS
ncbi:MAG: peptidyl-prolyl cis-trans isomerase [Candidatus Nitrospinota bacterium M3_3B_026]